MEPIRTDPVRTMSTRDWIEWLKIAGIIGTVATIIRLAATLHHRSIDRPHHTTPMLAVELAVYVGLTALGIYLHRRWLARTQHRQAS